MKERNYLAMFLALFVAEAHAGVAWPDPKISVPEEVRQFIVSECLEFRGWGEETVDECIIGEMYGYRAVVMMLMDEELGKRAAERYRGCAAGLGRLGGRFHRRKAGCVSRAYCIVWRFEYSRETNRKHIRRTDFIAPPSSDRRAEALRYALSVMESEASADS